jgi:hypothetical protein
MNRRHLERTLRVFADHYNAHRPHRSLNLKPPDPAARKLRVLHPSPPVERQDRLGGLLHEYRLAAKPTLRTPHDIDQLRANLAGRADAGFDRIEDAVSELVSLHAVTAEDIIARVMATITAEQQRI